MLNNSGSDSCATQWNSYRLGKSLLYCPASKTDIPLSAGDAMQLFSPTILAAILLFCGMFLMPSAIVAQTMTEGLDFSSPAFTEAELSRADVIRQLKNARTGEPVDFTGKSLNGVDLSGLDLSNAIFRSARLNKANFAGCTLKNAVLDQAWMISADLTGADVAGASLFQTQLVSARLDGADLSNARIAADLTRASLKRATMRNADFSADMRNQSMGLMRGVLRLANLNEADLTGANLARADLEFASLQKAILIGANLMGAEAGGADLTGADIRDASFQGADLDSARLISLKGETQSSFQGAINLRMAIRR